MSQFNFRHLVKSGTLLLTTLVMSTLPQLAPATITGTLPLPSRPANAMTGTQFYNLINGLSDSEREQHIVNEIATGNIPDFLRDMIPVTVTENISGTDHTVTYFVTPDYMAIGSDSDFFRMPMSAPLAQQIADLCDSSLPTRKISDDIWSAATIQLSPYPYSPTYYNIDSVPVFWLHNQSVETQRAGTTLGDLIGGIKKDVVITPQIATRPSPARVAIYGWHYTNGTPIQPLSLVHESTYEDYSHGIRLIEKAILVDNIETTVPDVLASSTLNALLSDEGAFSTVYPIPNPYPLPGTVSIENGSFESGFTSGVGNGWTAFTNTGSATLTFGRAGINKVDGSYSQYWKRSDTQPVDGGVYQTITTEADQYYQIGAWLKQQSIFTEQILEFGYDPTGGTNPTAASVVYTDLTSGGHDVWVEYDQVVQATGTSMTLFARAGHTDTSGGTCYFYLDAVTITEAEAPAPTNLIQNPGFEETYTSGVAEDWTQWTAPGSNTYTINMASYNKHEGDHSQYIARGDTATFDGGVYQTVTVEDGATYEVTAWMKRQCTFTGAILEFGYDSAGGTNGSSTSVVYTDLTAAGNNLWVSYSDTVVASGTSLTVFARGGHTGTTGDVDAYLYVDEVSVTKTQDAPTITEVIVDNDDGSPDYTETGSWVTSSSSGYDGGTYKWASAGLSTSATWTADIPAAGDWTIEVIYRAGANRTTSTSYTVQTSSGSQSTTINQTLNDLQWVSLGTYSLSAGDSTVSLNSASSSGGSVVIADAVRFTWSP
jgi:hypothetical protein